jgi:uncharacterized phiE125 gp8 family phage protein
MLKPVRTVAPTIEPISVAEARRHLRVDDTDQDELIAGLIAAAAAYLDGHSGILGRSLVNQTWAQKYPQFPSGAVLGLALAPVQSITSVTYYDAANAAQILSSDVYTLLEDVLGPFVTLQADQSWPSTYCREDAVTVTFVAGYGATATSVPAPIRQAMLLMIGAWFENREQTVIGVGVQELPQSVAINALLTPYRRIYV